MISVEKKLNNLAFRVISNAFSKSKDKKIQFTESISDPRSLNLKSSCVVSSPSAWALFRRLHPSFPEPNTLILSPSIEIQDVKKMAASIKERHLIGIGGGRIMDATKALAKLGKSSCILIPSILSTTAWLNPTASLKKGATVHHASGKYDQVIIDCNLIANAPPHLNFGGLMDLLVGYSGLADWKLKKNRKGGYFPKIAEEIILDFCARVRLFLDANTEINPDQVPEMVRFFIEGLSTCYGLLSGRPMESGEHFLYYAIEEKINRPMNHGAVISLCTIICLQLHGNNSYLPYETFKNEVKNCGIEYSLSNLGISADQLRAILKDMKKFVELKKLPFSVWNVKHDFETFSFESLV